MNGEPAIRLIIDAPAPGPWNMAVDEAILLAAADEEVATLRLYEWEEPTLSLGYFQRLEDRRKHSASLACPVVRRQSGGGAIVHDRELTYSLTLPTGHLWSRRSQLLYSAVHQAIIEVLTQLASAQNATADLALVSAGSRQPTTRTHPDMPEPFLCFRRRSPCDVILRESSSSAPSPADQGWKIVGSAQRRHRGTVLQHGSVLLSRSAAAPELPGFCDLIPTTIAPSTLAAPLSTAIADTLGAATASASLPESLYSAAQGIARDKYAADSWTKRR